MVIILSTTISGLQLVLGAIEETSDLSVCTGFKVMSGCNKTCNYKKKKETVNRFTPTYIKL
jgi:hypothetical protein